jgi:hypothetical protein
MACSGDDRRPPPPPPVIADAALAVVLPEEPLVSDELDPDDVSGSRREWRSNPRSRRGLEITLRSSPSGATAAVDGVIVGRTPALWEGEFTGREREFTFVLPGYSMARYRFAPTTSGVVHGKLERMGDGDAGVPQIPQPELIHRDPPPVRAPRPPAAPDAQADAAVAAEPAAEPAVEPAAPGVDGGEPTAAPANRPE